MPILSSISEIRMGATLRGRDATRPDPNGSYRFIRIGDVSQEGTFKTTDFIRIEPNEKVNSELLLRQGDVLFPNRGTRTTAVVYRVNEPQTIVGAQFFIVRTDSTRLLPEYLAWFLRSEEAARYFETRRKGSYVQIIQRGDLAELEVPMPPLVTQRKIVEAANLMIAERQLTDRLDELKRQLFGARLLRATKHSCEQNSEDSHS
jgi:restriction endonuclease S subunit